MLKDCYLLCTTPGRDSLFMLAMWHSLSVRMVKISSSQKISCKFLEKPQDYKLICRRAVWYPYNVARELWGSKQHFTVQYFQFPHYLFGSAYFWQETEKTLSFGTHWRALTWMTRKISIGGNWMPQGYSQQDQPINFFLSGPSPLNLGRKCGRLGCPGNAKHLCGWLFGIAVGLQIVYKKEAFHILSAF